MVNKFLSWIMEKTERIKADESSEIHCKILDDEEEENDDYDDDDNDDDEQELEGENN